MDEVVNKWEKPFHIERGDVYMADLGPEYAADKGIQAGTGSENADRIYRNMIRQKERSEG